MARSLQAAFEHGGHIQLLKLHATGAEPFAGNLLQPLDLAGGFAAAMGFEQADHHIAAVPEPFAALLEQAAGLAHPRAMPINTLWRQRRWLERIIGAGEELSGPSETGRYGAGQLLPVAMPQGQRERQSERQWEWPRA